MALIPSEIESALRPHLAAIAKIFRAPRITIVVRGPGDGNAGGDLVLSNDNPTLALHALRARAVAEGEILAGTPAAMNVWVKPPSDARPHFQNDDPGAILRPSGNNLKKG